MKYITDKEFKLQNTAVSLGKFDGIHLGHRMLINQVLEEKSKGYESVVFTFSLHPMSLFSDKEVDLIYTEEEKIRLLESLGIDTLISYPFTKETAQTEPEDFIKNILVEQLGAKVIVVGSDYRFGKNRSGDVELLKEFSTKYGYEVVVFDKLKVHDQIVSSTLIRQYIEKGDMESANELLGSPYTITGKVVHGRKLGRTLGIPTTNMLSISNKLYPPNGVYASKTIVDGIEYYGVTSIGTKPTVDDQNVKGIETYLFYFDQEIYDKIIDVQIYEYLRPEVKFDTLEELRAQMYKDTLNAGRYFGISKK